MKIYLPDISAPCYVVLSEEVIRAYDRNPSYNTSYNYRDYYVRSNYMYKDGTGNWGTYSTLPVCLDNSILTNDVYYRQDIDKILIIFLIITIFAIYLPIKIFTRLFRRFN